MGRPFKCPFCQASESVPKGFRKTKTMGLRKIRRCRVCKRKFTPRFQQSSVADPSMMGPDEDETTESDAEPGPGAVGNDEHHSTGF